MKLRMKGNSIRLRLTQSEVASLRDGGRIEESCDFGPQAQLRWALEGGAEDDEIRAVLDGARITVSVPCNTLRNWADGDKVGIYATSGTVEVAIEKDFRCVTRAGDAEEVDAFPNPMAC